MSAIKSGAKPGTRRSIDRRVQILLTTAGYSWMPLAVVAIEMGRQDTGRKQGIKRVRASGL